MNSNTSDQDRPAVDDEFPVTTAPWDLLVVGGGTAGIVAASTARALGCSVLLVESSRTGGDCLWSGCVPSKALLAAAHAAADARRADTFGVHADVRVDLDEVLAHIRSTITRIEPDDSAETLRGKGIHVAFGSLTFTGPDRAVIVRAGVGTPDREKVGTPDREQDRRPVWFRQAVIATGSVPAVPDLLGLADVEYLTTDTLWEQPALPTDLLVLGGGSVGCELGQALARLGGRVVLVERSESLLPREDADAAAAVLTALRDDGVDVRLDAEVAQLERTPTGGVGARLADGTTVTTQDVLVATGRRPRTDELGLAAAGVELDDDGAVRVDDQLRTSQPRIWAAGDVTSYPRFTHVAGVHGSIAASNAVLGLHRRVDSAVVPRVTFTQPEVAAAGVSTGGVSASGVPTGGTRSRRGVVVRTVLHADVDRAVTDRQTDGMTRIVMDRRSKILGVTIVGPRAGESLGEAVLAIRSGSSASRLAGIMHAYPTYGDGWWNATIEQAQHQLRSRPVRLATRLLVWWNRRSAGRRSVSGHAPR